MTLVVPLLAAAAAAHAAGGQAGAFLRQDAAARPAGLAGAGAATTDDAASLLLNPAALSRLQKPEVSATRALVVDGSAFDVFSAGYPSRWGGWSASYARQSTDGFERRTGPNDAPESFSIEQSALLVGWGHALGFGALRGIPGVTEAKPLHVGLAFKAASERIDRNSASGRGMDAGVILKPNARFALGARVQNAVAPELTYLSTPIRYARAVELTPAALFASRDWDGAAAVRWARVADEGVELGGGAELRYARSIAVRAGWRRDGPTAGFGLRLGNTSFDYASALGGLGPAHLFTLTQRFGLTREELEDTIRRGIQKLTRAEAAKLSRAYQKKAEGELREGRYPEALRDMEAAALLLPDDAGLRREIESIQQRWDDSMRRDALERARSQARRQMENGDLIGARQSWRVVLDLDLGNVEAVDSLRRIDEQISREERARLEGLRHARVAGEVAESLAAAAALAGRARFRQARLEAEKTLRRHPGNRDLEGFLEQVDRQAESWAEARLSESEKLEKGGDAAGALRALDEALSSLPGHAALSARAEELRRRLGASLTGEQRRSVEQLYYRAVERYLKGDYPSADSLADDVLKLDPGHEGGRALKEKLRAAQRASR